MRTVDGGGYRFGYGRRRGRRSLPGLALAVGLGGCATPSSSNTARLEDAIQALTQSIERLNARLDGLEGRGAIARKAPKTGTTPKAAKTARTTKPPKATPPSEAAAPVAAAPVSESRTEDAVARSVAPAVEAPAAPSGPFVPDAELFVCPRIKVSNRPHINRSRKIIYYRPFVRVADKVNVAVAPQNGACLTSGYGKRRGKKHRGVDYQGKPAPMIHAAAAGTILEAEYRDDYGNSVVIDHGHGVYTRYAHLKAFRPGIKAGKKVPFGQPLGRMGSSAKWKLPLHLHYEILTGNYDTPKKSFGLKPKDPFWLLFESRPRS